MRLSFGCKGCLGVTGDLPSLDGWLDGIRCDAIMGAYTLGMNMR